MYVWLAIVRDAVREIAVQLNVFENLEGAQRKGSGSQIGICTVPHAKSDLHSEENVPTCIDEK